MYYIFIKYINVAFIVTYIDVDVLIWMHRTGLNGTLYRIVTKSSSNMTILKLFLYIPYTST
ncbi:hypothetical protein HanPI659440_Chr06g0238941 [Helianthus annuus]|nr:hypothetical protein HanPI659440_Chr06g0238941 [Helianthus annuus]